MKRILIAAAAAALAGCGEDETIRTYTTPKEPTWRMIAALVPAGDATWFFKVVASTPRATPHKAEIEAFLGSLKVEGGDVRWTLPAGWTEDKGRGDRVATLAFGALELTVTKLGGAAGGPLANVNRWRGQLGLPPLAEAELEANSVALPGGGLRVDFEGPKKPSMGAPMAGGAAPPPPPPPPEHGEDLDAVRELLAYSIPSGWTVNPRPGAAVREIKDKVGIRVCTSLGILEREQAFRLKEAGVDRFNHNLETSERHFDKVCSTHTYQERVRTIQYVHEAGMESCCGGIVGMGEADEDVVDLAFDLRRLGVTSIPVNFLNPRPGTPLGNLPVQDPKRCLRVLCMVRFVNPSRDIRCAGGREVNLRSLQPMLLYPCNSIFTNGYLTTGGNAESEDFRMIRDLGFEPLAE